jgi:MoaA/NifB/PqqE/SkfB family radical SAM enzyme
MKPLVCNYFITSACNDSCEFCSCWHDDGYKALKDSDTDSVKRNLRDIKQAGVYILNITGGEPTLRGDLGEILRYAKKLGFFNVLSTNGIEFSQKAPSILPFVDHLVFSLDAPTNVEHDRIRGTESYSHVMDGISLAKEMGVMPFISFTVTRDSLSLMPEMVELAEKLGVLLWINPVYNWHDVHGFEKGSIEYISRYKGRKNVAMNPAALKFAAKGGNDTGHTVCRAGSGVITVLPDGSYVFPCVHLQKYSVRSGLMEGLKKKESGIAISWQGRGDVCRGCMDWSYFNQSFLRSPNQYLVPSLISLWDLFWKEIRLKSRLIPASKREEGEIK